MKKIFSFLLLTFSTFVLAQTANDAAFTVAEGATYTGNLTGESAQSFTVSATPKNGTVTIQNNGSFTYVHNGAESTTDSFTFTVSDSNNTSSSAATVTITVTPVNDVPTVTATATKTINEGETVTLVVSGTDTEGATLVYEVTTPPTEGTFLINKSTGSGTYVHGGGEASSDKIVVKVKESDYNASFSSQTITITVTGINDAPIAPDLTIAVSEGGTSQPYSFGAYDAEISSTSTINNDATGNNTAGSLTYSITGQGLYGKATAGTDGTVTYVHAGSENNKDTFSYSVSDGTLTSSGEVTVNVTPTNDAPSGVADTYFVHKTGSIQIPAETGLLRNDIDLDSDFGSLQVLAGQTSAKYGDVNLSPDGSFVYTTSTTTTISDNTTSDTFTYVVYDGEFNSSETTVTIEFTNLYGANHFYSTTEGGTLQVVDSLGVLKSAYESNNLALTAVVDTKPSHGTVEIGTNGSFNYVHDGSENRIDSFTYKVQNANEDESKPSFVIIKNTNVNDAPTSSGSKITVAEGGSVIFTPSYVDTDTSLSDMVFEVPTSTTNGIIYPSEIGNQFIYKHNGGETSTDVFAYTVYDGIADKLTDLTANITITSVNDAPVANEQSVTVSEGAQDVPITFTGTDAESDALTYKLVTQPANGNVSVSSTGTFTYTHDGVQVDNDSFLIVANDGSSDSAQTQISITVNLVDDKPVVSPLSLSIAEGASTTFNLGNNISDEEGASLSLAITQLPSDGVLTYGGAQISSGDLPKTFSGDLIYTHNGGESKSDVFQFQAYTGNSIPVNSEGALDASSSALSEIGKVKVSFSSVNDAPVIGDLTIAVDQFDETSFVVPATDAETEDLTYNISSEPSKGSLLSNGGNSYTYFNASSTDLTGSSETDSFTIEVSDGDLTVSKAYTITVNGINEDLPQVILTSSSNTMTETTGGSAATQTITATLVSNDFFSDRRDMDAVSVAKGSTNSQGYVYLGEYGGHYYYLHKEHKSWGDAKNAALTRGGYLVALETQAEMNAVKALMNDINEMNWIWLGLSYNIELSGSNITTNKWKWSNGASLEDNSTLWQDNNTWDSSNDGTYLNVSKGSWYPNQTNTRNGVSNIGYMNNGYENNNFWYIVEYDNALTAAQNITFTVDAASSSTAVKDTDFSLSATSLTIASGSSGTSFVVTEIQDSVGENNETIVLEASNVSSNARLKNSQKSITIELLDNENTTVGISANSTNVNEASGSVTLTATLGKTRPTDTDITLNFSGTATIDEDYATNDDVYFTTIATSFSNAEGAVQATNGDYYVAQERTLFKVTSDGTKTIISGDGNWGNHSTEAQGASQAKFRNIGKMVIDKASAYSFGARDGDSSTAPQDVIYFYDETIIRKLDLGNNIMYYITGSSDYSQNFVNGSFVEARFNQIRDITLSNDGNKLYVIDRNGIRTIDLANETVSTLAGQNDWGYQDGSLSSAQFEGPEGLAMDSYGDLFVRQYGKIRKIDIDGDSVTTVLENDWHAGDLIIDPNNNIYYAGRDNNQIYLLTGGVSETSGAKPLTGLGELSLIVDSSADPGTVDGLKGVAKIESPAEIFYDGSGLVFVQSKSSNGSLRKIDFATKLRIPKGQTTGTFTFDVTDDTSYENDETIQVKISSAPLLTFDSAVVQETITINGSDSSLAGYDAKPQVQLTSAKTSISESGSNNSTILTFQLGDASESGARLDMSPGLKKDYEYLGSIGTHKYYMSYDHESWTRANEIASSAGGYLLVLDDAPENTWVNSNIPDDYRWNSFWMGYHDSVNEGDFQWVNGSDSSYTNWNNGEPNNAGGEDYVELLNNGRWNDLPNNHHRRFIIEFSGTVSSLPTQITYTVTGDTAEFNYPTVAPITIAAGETTATVTVAANADTDDEGADAITYTITSAGSNGTVGAKDAVTVSIDDDDNPSVTLAAPSDTSFNEKNGTLAISATIDNIKPFATSLGLTINGGGSDTAVLGDDYEIAELSSVTTFAGSGISGYTDETGASAQFDQPSGMTLDSSGNLYVADRENQVIRKITPSGVVTTFAGNGEWAHDREEGPKLEVGITNPRALAFDSNGNLYVGENGRNRISKIDTNGNVTHVIGQGDHGDSDGDKTQAQFNWISGMVFDSAGNLFVADAGAGKVKKITFAAGTGRRNFHNLCWNWKLGLQ